MAGIIRSGKELIGKRIVVCDSIHMTPKQKLKWAFFRTEQNKIVEIKARKDGIITGIYVVRPHKRQWVGNSFKVVKWRKTRKLVKLDKINPPIRRVRRDDGWKWETTDQNGIPNWNRVRLAKRQNGSGGKQWRYGGATLGWFLNNQIIMEQITFPRLEIE